MKKRSNILAALALTGLLTYGLSVTVMAAETEEAAVVEVIQEEQPEQENPDAITEKAEEIEMDIITEEAESVVLKKEPVEKGTWRLDSKGWWYQNPDGTYPVNQWQEIDGKLYLFDGRGYMKTGWQYSNYSWYYLNGSGAMQTGWLKDGGIWYYLKEDGVMATGWVLDGDTWYYMNGSGAMQTGWLKSGNTWYYLNGSGAMQTGWLKDGGYWYYLNENGAMVTGWALDGDTWYYMNGSGAMQTGWLKSGNTWYYLNGSGAMQTGWLKDGGYWYYLNENGAMVTGWVTVDGERYYLNGNGTMKTGWLNVGGSWYYLYSNGVMAKDTVVNGYTINEDGVWEDNTSKKLQVLVDQVIAEHTSAAMTQEAKLRAVYNYMCDTSVFKYRRIYPLQELYSGWETVNAYEMLSTHNGNCYHFGSAFGMLARALGYDARIISGQITAAIGGFTPHCWVEIDIDGVTYLFDCEMEHAKGYDLFKKTYSSVHLTYIK